MSKFTESNVDYSARTMRIIGEKTVLFLIKAKYVTNNIHSQNIRRKIKITLSKLLENISNKLESTSVEFK